MNTLYRLLGGSLTHFELKHTEKAARYKLLHDITIPQKHTLSLNKRVTGWDREE